MDGWSCDFVISIVHVYHSLYKTGSRRPGLSREELRAHAQQYFLFSCYYTIHLCNKYYFLIIILYTSATNIIFE